MHRLLARMLAGLGYAALTRCGAARQALEVDESVATTHT